MAVIKVDYMYVSINGVKSVYGKIHGKWRFLGEFNGPINFSQIQVMLDRECGHCLNIYEFKEV